MRAPPFALLLLACRLSDQEGARAFVASPDVLAMPEEGVDYGLNVLSGTLFGVETRLKQLLTQVQAHRQDQNATAQVVGDTLDEVRELSGALAALLESFGAGLAGGAAGGGAGAAAEQAGASGALQDRARELERRVSHYTLQEKARSGSIRMDYQKGTIRGKGMDTQGLSSELLHRLRIESDPATPHLDSTFFSDFVIFVAAAAAGGLVVSVVFGLPVTLGFIVGGMAVGPSGFRAVRNVTTIETLTQIGSVFLLFRHGVCAGSHGASSARYASLRHGLLATLAFQVMATLLIASCIKVLGVTASTGQATIFAICASLCSTPLVSESLAHSGVPLNTRAGRALLSVLTCQDLFVLPLLIVPSFLENARDASPAALGRQLLALICLVTVTVTLGRMLLPMLVTFVSLSFRSPRPKRRAAADGESVSTLSLSVSPSTQQSSAKKRASLKLALADEGSSSAEGSLLDGSRDRDRGDARGSEHLTAQLLTVLLAVYALLLALMCERLGLSTEVGALIGGMVMHGDATVMKAVERHMLPLTDLFGSLYMASFGMLLSPHFLLEHLIELVCTVVAIFVCKVLIMGFVFKGFGVASDKAVTTAALLAQTSELCLFVVVHAERTDLLSRHSYLVYLGTTVIFLGLHESSRGCCVKVSGWLGRSHGDEGPDVGLWERLTVAFEDRVRTVLSPLFRCGSEPGRPRRVQGSA